MGHQGLITSKRKKLVTPQKANREGKRAFSALIPLAFLVVFALVLFSKIILTGKSLYGSDFIFQFYPWKNFIYDHVWQKGSLPFWNPYLFSGTPFIANIQASMFYPAGFLYYVLPPDLAYGLSTMLHCILGSIFMYMFMRTLKLSQTSSLISALIFSFNGYFMGHLYAGHLSFVQSYIWIPLLFHLLYRFTERTDLKYAVAAGLVLGVQALGGFPQITFYTLLGSFLFGLYQGSILLKTRAFRDAVGLAMGFAILLCVGFGLSAVQMLPTLEFAGHSTRAGGISYAFATYDSLHPKDLLAFIIPDIFGNPIDGTYWPSKEIWHFWESCGYVGVFPLLLLFITTKSSPFRPLRTFFLVLIAISLLLALGKYNPLYPIIYKLPGFDRFRIPAQIIFLYIFSVAVASGMGVQAMEEGTWRFNKGIFLFLAVTGFLLLLFLVGLHLSPFKFFLKLFKNFSTGPVTHANMEMLYDRMIVSISRSALFFSCGLLFIVLHKKRRLAQWVFKVLLPAIILVDLYLFGSQFIRSYAFPSPVEKKNIVAQLGGNPSQGRVIPNSQIFLPNDGLLHTFPSVLGYDPLILRRYIYFIQSSQDQRFDDHVVNLGGLNNPNAKLMGLLNVNRLLLNGEIVDLKINNRYLNIVQSAVIKSHDEVLPFMKSDEFDPLTMVILEQENGQVQAANHQSGPISGSGSVLAYDNEAIRIRTSSDQRGFLVLSEIFYPGWRATVDGKEAGILRGNYLFRVIPLEKGDHEVYLYFVSWPFRIGLMVSFLTLILSICFIVKKTRR